MSGNGLEKQQGCGKDDQNGEKASAAHTATSKPILLTRGLSRKILTYIHNWGGLLTTAYLILFLLTGVFLNNRFFNNMRTSEDQTVTFDPEEKAAAQRFIAATKRLTAAIEPYTKRPDFDTIHVKRNGQADYLDRSGGKKWTFSVLPSGETMVWGNSIPKQPWYLMNKLHMLDHTHPAWVVLSTTVCVLIFLVLLTGVLLVRWKRLQVILVLAGAAVLALAIAFHAPPSARRTGANREVIRAGRPHRMAKPLLRGQSYPHRIQRRACILEHSQQGITDVSPGPAAWGAGRRR